MVVDGLAVYGLRSIDSPPSVTLQVISMGGRTLLTPDRRFLSLSLSTGEVLLFKL